jgi:zinc and cadmium transporter
MADPWIGTLVSVAIISIISFAGLLTLPFSLLRRHGVLFGLIALAAGTLLGDALFHLLPEAVELWTEFSLPVGILTLGGFLAFYAIESALRIGHAHGEEHHDRHELVSFTDAPSAEDQPHPSSGTQDVRAATVRPSAAIMKAAAPIAEKSGIQPFGVLNLVGDAVHNFLDGIVVAAAFLVDTPTGVATAIAVAIHEIPQEFGDFGVLLRAGFRPFKAAMMNLVSAVFAILGAILLLVLPFETETLEKFALPIVAGGFLYIAAADLIPELHHHTKPRYIPTVVLLLVAGIGIMAALTFLE